MVAALRSSQAAASSWTRIRAVSGWSWRRRDSAHRLELRFGLILAVPALWRAREPAGLACFSRRLTLASVDPRGG